MPTESISSLLHECKPLELLTKQALIKSFREACGQVKTLADSVANANTVLATETEFSSTIKKGFPYLVDLDFIIVTGATPGLTLQLNLPANTTTATTFVGEVVTYTAAAIATGTLSATGSLNTPIKDAATAWTRVMVKGLLTAGVADDLLTVSFAQHVSDASDTKIVRGSTWKVLKLGNFRKSPVSV